MAGLKEAIAKHRRAQNGELNVSALMEEVVREVVAEKLPAIEGGIRSQLTQLILRAIKQGLAEGLRGPKGDQGDQGNEPEVDLEEVARTAAQLIPPPEVDYATLVQKVLALIPAVDEEKIAKRVVALLPPIDEEELEEETEDDEVEESPDELIDKMLKAKKKLGISAIEGLEPALKAIRAAVRDKKKGGEGGGVQGGGMGNTQHERFIVTSATTTVQLSKRIAADGYAIMSASYNNGTLMRGKDYTVGNDHRTLTLLFTPDDPTAGQLNLVHVVYIRT